jgi:hypothetical protein
MADSTITLNAPTVAGGPVMGTATDSGNANYQKVVVGNDIGGLAAPITSSNPLAVSQTGTATVGGVTGSGSANSGNPVKAGAVYNSSPITLATGQVGDLQADASGFLKVNIAAGAAAGGTSSTFNATFPSAGTAIGLTNGTNMVAAQADGSGFLKVNVAAGATQAVVDNSTGWVSGTSQALPIAGFYQTSPTALTSGDFGIPLMSKQRQWRTVLDGDANANSGGALYGLVAPGTPAATAIKTTPGSIAWIHATNDTTGPVYLKFYNLATGSVTLGSTSCLFQCEIPGNASSTGAGFTVSLAIPIPFTTAITYAVTGAISFTDNTSITASKVNIAVLYF